MGQSDIIDFLRNKRLSGDDSYFSVHEISKGLSNGSSLYHNVRKSLYNLVRMGIVETQASGDVFEWVRVFRLSDKYLEED